MFVLLPPLAELLVLRQYNGKKKAYCWNCPWRQCPGSYDCCLWNVPPPHPSHAPRTRCRLLQRENWNKQTSISDNLWRLKTGRYQTSMTFKDKATHLYPMSLKPLSVMWTLWMLKMCSLHSSRPLQLGSAVWCMTTLRAKLFSLSSCLGGAARHCALDTILTEKQSEAYSK